MVKSIRDNQKGQSLLIVVLVMIIALTVGLALISRTITGIKTSTEEANSQKALGAAEAGIEQSIKTNQDFENKTSIGTDAKFTTTIQPINANGKSFLLNGGDVVQSDDDSDVWLSNYSTDSAKLYSNPIANANLTFSFNEGNSNCPDPTKTAAIKIDIISGPKTAPTQTTHVYDPCGSRRTSNNFSTPQTPGNTVSGVGFSNDTDAIPVTNGLFVRITPIYASTKIGITSDTLLPSQGSIIQSTGFAGSTQRKISVYQGFPKIPAEFFPYTLFSP